MRSYSQMRRCLLFCMLALWVAPGMASAQRCDAPAGAGAIDEYCEVVPGSEGDHDAGPSSGGPGISDSTAAALAGEGDDGEALSRSLGKDPATAKPGKRGGASKAPVTGSSSADVPGSNPFSAVSQAVSGSSTIGAAFFLALIAVVLFMLGSAWVGWRRSSAS